MRTVAALILLTTPANAWEFTPGAPCLLTHNTPQAQIELTYDPTAPLYSITITRADPWPDAPSFGIRFDGPQGRVIATDRHQLSSDGRSITATDRGFGNVLDGLQFNHKATAASGDIEVTIPLDGAAAPVAAFRACNGTAFSS